MYVTFCFFFFLDIQDLCQRSDREEYSLFIKKENIASFDYSKPKFDYWLEHVRGV